MQPTLASKRSILLLLLSVALVGSVGYMALAEQSPAEVVKQPDAKLPEEVVDRNKKFAEQLSGVTLVGHFSVSGQAKSDLTAERYHLQGVMHVEGEKWLFQARIRYGDHDVTLPITLPVRWAGDTPVICVDKMGFPGLGTYTARVMIYDDHYAGFWQGADHQGHLFGMIERVRNQEGAGQ